MPAAVQMTDLADESSKALRIRDLEAELARAYVELADAANLCKDLFHEDMPLQFRQLGERLVDTPNATHCHCNCTEPSSEGAFMPPFTEEWWTYFGASLGCICTAALA